MSLCNDEAIMNPIFIKILFSVSKMYINLLKDQKVHLTPLVWHMFYVQYRRNFWKTMIWFLALFQLTTYKLLPLPLKCSQIGFWLQNVAQFSETYEKKKFPIFSRFLVFEIWSIFCSKYLENWKKKSKWQKNVCLLRCVILRSV